MEVKSLIIRRAGLKIFYGTRESAVQMKLAVKCYVSYFKLLLLTCAPLVFASPGDSVDYRVRERRVSDNWADPWQRL